MSDNIERALNTCQRCNGRGYLRQEVQACDFYTKPAPLLGIKPETINTPVAARTTLCAQCGGRGYQGVITMKVQP